MNRLARSLLLLLAVLTAGCPRPPLRFGPEGELTDPQALIDQMQRRAGNLQSLRAEAKAKIKTPQQSGSASQFIAVRHPGSLHIETLNFFGKPVAIFVANPERFAYYNAELGTYVAGPAAAANLSRLLPIELMPPAAVRILLSDVPLIDAENKRLEIDADARAYKLTLQRGQVTQTVFVGTEDFRPLKSQVRGEPSYDLFFDDFQAFGALVFPARLKFVSVDARGKSTGVEIDLHFQEDTELNPALDPALFNFPPPPNARVTELDAQGREVPPPPDAEGG